MNKTYILLQDYNVPEMTIPAGTESNLREFRNGRNVFSFCNGKQCKLFNESEILNAPEFFKIKEEEKIVISDLFIHANFITNDGVEYQFSSSNIIPPEKFPVIIKAIENAVNGIEDKVVDKFNYSHADVNTIFGELNTLRLIHKAYQDILEKNPGLKRNEKLFTKDDMYKCFIAGHNNGVKTVPIGIDQAASAYINSLNKH